MHVKIRIMSLSICLMFLLSMFSSADFADQAEGIRSIGVSDLQIRKIEPASNSGEDQPGDESSDADSISEMDAIRYEFSYDLLHGSDTQRLKFTCIIQKMETQNAYNGILIARDIQLTEDNELQTEGIQCVFETPEYRMKSQALESSEADTPQNSISLYINGIQYVGSRPVHLDSTAIDEYEIVTEADGLTYLEAIQSLRYAVVYTNTEDTAVEDEPWSPASENTAAAVPARALSSAGDAVRAIIGNDSWFKSSGKSMKEISGSRRVCVKNTGMIFDSYQTDVLIWQYTLTNVNLSGAQTASIQLNLLYSVTILYNSRTGTWSDYGANSSSMFIRNTTVGIKTTGTCNNDYFYKVEQRGAYNTGSSGSSPVADVLKKVFFKVVPYGSQISTGLDILSSFVKSDNGDFASGFGVKTFDTEPSAHFLQNGGYVRSALMNSNNYNLCNDSHYQQQLVYVYKRPSNCVKSFVYQSHYEVVGYYTSGITTLYNSGSWFQQSYS